MTDPQPDHALGIREKLRPFQNFLQVFFVGMTVGMPRTSASGMTIHGASFASETAAVAAAMRGILPFGGGAARVNDRDRQGTSWITACPVGALQQLAS